MQPLLAAEKIGGAPIDQLLAMGGMVGAWVALILVLGLGRKGGPLEARIPVQRWGRRTVLGIPAWAAVPAGLSFLSMVVTTFGTHWDVATHLDNGRDPGPLGNPSHYWQLAGLVGCFGTGWLAMVMAGDDAGPRPIRITRTWRVPIGAVILTIFGANVLIMFPIDDIWHRVFGEDITLWSPTHWSIMFGGPWTFFGILVLLAEGRWAAKKQRGEHVFEGLRGIAKPNVQTALVTGGLLYTFAMFMSEWDHGIAQFPFAEHPLVLCAGAALALTVAVSIGGRGAALGAVLTFIVARVVYTAIVGGPLGHTAQYSPLFLGEAMVVELLAVWLGTRRQLRFGLAVGAAMGTLGLLFEALWSYVGMQWQWPWHMTIGALPEVLAGSIGGGILGALVVEGLRGRLGLIEGRKGIALAAVGILLPVGAGVLISITDAPKATATFALTEAEAPRPAEREDERWAHMTIRIDPASETDDYDWFHILAWNAKEKIIRDGLEQQADGSFRTTRPIPVSRPWKSMLRLHRGDSQGAVAIYLPESKELKTAEVPALPRFTRPFVEDRRLLQRERDHDPPMALWTAASAFYFRWMFFLFGVCAFLLRRYARGVSDGPPRAQRPQALPDEPRVEREAVPVA